MFKKCPVVMLPTNEKAPMFIGKTHHVLHKASNSYADEEYRDYQHLYFLSNQKVREGDEGCWVHINSASNNGKGHLTKIRNFNSGHPVFTVEVTEGLAQIHNLRKVIGTTDTSIKKDVVKYTSCATIISENLPEPSNQFQEKYIEEYNKGKIITDVMIEHENYGFITRTHEDLFRVKVKNDNTMSIKKVKNYSQEEVDELLDRQTSVVTAQMLDKFKGCLNKEEIINLLYKLNDDSGDLLGKGYIDHFVDNNLK